MKLFIKLARFLFFYGRTTRPATSRVMTIRTRGIETSLQKNPRARGRPRFDARTRHFACFQTTGVAKIHANAPLRVEYDPENREALCLFVLPQFIPKVYIPRAKNLQVPSRFV